MNDSETLRRLLALNCRGIYLECDPMSGQVTVSQDDGCDWKFDLRTVSINGKFYGGIIEAINTIEKALQADGQETLLEFWANRFGQVEDKLLQSNPANLENLHPRLDEWLF